MKFLSSKSVFTYLVVILLSSCASQSQLPEKSSGINSDYTALDLVQNSSDQAAWAWKSDKLSLQQYKQVLIDVLEFLPEHKTNDLKSKVAFEKVRNVTDKLLRDSAESQGVQLASSQGPAVLRLRTAITAVDSSELSMKKRQPVALAWSGETLVIDKPESDFSLVFEYVLLDSKTGDVVERGVRQFNGDRPNGLKNISLDNAKSIFEKMVKDFAPNLKTYAVKMSN